MWDGLPQRYLDVTEIKGMVTGYGHDMGWSNSLPAGTLIPGKWFHAGDRLVTDVDVVTSGVLPDPGM